MAKITIDMNKEKAFFSSKLGQAVLTEMAKSEDLEFLSAVVDCEYASKDAIAGIIKRLTEAELVKMEKDVEYSVAALNVIVKATQSKNADAATLDAICNFAIKLIVGYQVGSTAYSMTTDMLKWLAVNPNTNETTLHKIYESNDYFARLIVQNSAISDKWLIEIIEQGSTQEKLAAVPELVRRLKARLQEESQT